MKKWFNWKVIICILGFIVLMIGGYFIYIYNEVRATFDAIHEPIVIERKEIASNTNDRPVSNQPSTTQSPLPVTFLLLGIDNWESTGRADTLLVITLNPETESMKILSIPRDTYTEIIGFDFKDKINHSYAFGGVKTTLLTVENLLDISIDYVVTVNMEGFIKMVDIVGGVTVNNDLAFSVDSYDFSEGNLTLSGDEALNYVRMRKEDPRGDFGRQMRQRQVLESIFHKAVSFNLIWQAPSILETIRDSVETNLTFDEMIQFQSLYKSTLNHIEHLNFSNGQGGIQNGIWYYFLNEDELLQMRQTLKESLVMK